jgi:three-Cys-motif partner protein
MAKLWGWWTRHKLQILEDYLQAFVTAARSADERIYLDLFAGWPDNVSRETDQHILGSAHRALRVRPPFTRLCLFEIGRKARRLDEAIRKQYPDRDGIRVYAGDCNAQVAHTLSDLREVCWAPTFVFVDQFASEVRWSTLDQIARFRRARTKAELWILFASGQYPRGLGIHGPVVNATYGETLTQMLGTEEWLHIVEARRRGVLTPAASRAEWVNLMRWRLQHELGYAESHAFTMKNTNGNDIYDMIFASDHPVGDRIMRHLYGKALSEHEDMRQHALALRRDRRRAEEAGEVALFPITPGMVKPASLGADRVYLHEPPHEPYHLPRSDR